MDRNITIRYFHLSQVRDDQLSFEEAAQNALNLGHSPDQRERTLGPGIVIRLERLNEQDGIFTGEVVRVQRENIPPEAQAHALVPLGIGGLGHSIAFAYDPQSELSAFNLTRAA